MLWLTGFEDLKFPVTPLLDYPHLFLFDSWSSLLFSRICLVLGNSFARGHLYNVLSLAFIEGAYQIERYSFSFSLENAFTAFSLVKALMLGKNEGKRRRGQQRMRWLTISSTQWHELEQTPGDSEGQRSLARFSPWGRKESDMTEWLNWTDIL